MVDVTTTSPEAGDPLSDRDNWPFLGRLVVMLFGEGVVLLLRLGFCCASSLWIALYVIMEARRYPMVERIRGYFMGEIMCIICIIHSSFVLSVMLEF